MYQVIIVDDEIWSLIGLKKIIQEDKERFQVIYETTDSLDALEQISIRKPDIVITDVRMPELSGIELMHSVRERGIKTEFIVVSGFAEFSYVQQALREGAFDYQLKPFDKNTLQAMLDKLYKKLESKSNVNDLEFYSLLRDRKDKVADLLQQRFGHTLYKKLQMVLLYYRDTDFKKILFEMGEDAQCLFLKVGPRKCIGIINSNRDETEKICQKLSLMENEIEKAALSRVGNTVEVFEQLLKETESAVMDTFVYPEKKIFRYKEPQRNTIHRLEEVIADMYANKNFRQMGEIISNFSDLFHEHNMGMEDAVYLWNRIALHSVKWSGENQLESEYLDIYELTERFTNIQEMSSYLNMQYLSDKKEQPGTVNDKFFEMLRFIDENYADTLFLKELCNDFYINMSYCCELFKKHKNMTFSQYLTDVRINKACDLLKYHKVTVSEACEMVGYKDYFYFNKVFKKKMGCTPSEYRKNRLVEG